MRRTTHLLTDDWSIAGKEYYLNIQELVDYIQLCNIDVIEVAHTDIAYKELPVPNSKRYHAADYDYPGIVCEGMENPMNKQYRLLDGRHRIQKLNEEGIFVSSFYNIPKRACCKLLQSR